MSCNEPILAGSQGDRERSLTPAARGLLCDVLPQAVGQYERTVGDLRGGYRTRTLGHIRQMREPIAVFGGSHGRV